MYALIVSLVVLQPCVRTNVEACIAMIPSSATQCADLHPAGCCVLFTTNLPDTDWELNVPPATAAGVPTGVDAYPSGTTIGTVTCGSKLTCLYSISTPAGQIDSGISPRFTCNCADPTSCAVSSSGATIIMNPAGAKGAPGTTTSLDCTDCTSATCIAVGTTC